MASSATTAATSDDGDQLGERIEVELRELGDHQVRSDHRELCCRLSSMGSDNKGKGITETIV